MVGVMRWIEFIGSALDQAGLRSGIKKGSECFGIGRTPAGLFAGSERASERANDGKRRALLPSAPDAVPEEILDFSGDHRLAYSRLEMCGSKFDGAVLRRKAFALSRSTRRRHASTRRVHVTVMDAGGHARCASQLPLYMNVHLIEFQAVVRSLFLRGNNKRTRVLIKIDEVVK